VNIVWAHDTTAEDVPEAIACEQRNARAWLHWRHPRRRLAQAASRRLARPHWRNCKVARLAPG